LRRRQRWNSRRRSRRKGKGSCLISSPLGFPCWSMCILETSYRRCQREGFCSTHPVEHGSVSAEITQEEKGVGSCSVSVVDIPICFHDCIMT
jgi:hypothetical protein